MTEGQCIGTERPRVDGSHRVAHVTTVHRPFDPRIFHKQLVSLREAGFDVHLVAPHDRAEQRKGISIHPLPTGRRGWTERLALQRPAYRAARALEADLYQIHDPELIPAAYALKKATGARIVYDMHENYRAKGAVWGRLLRGLERWCFRWVDHVFLAEESYRSVVESSVPHTSILNYARPPEGGASEATPASTSARVPERLLYTGTVGHSRGLQTMLDLTAALRRRGEAVYLDLVGVCNHADQRAAAETQIREQQLGEAVTRVGWDTFVPPSEMEPYYRRADVGLALLSLHPNHVGSMPTKFYEYLHYGLPIIASDVPLWRRFIERHGCGAVVPPGDPEAALAVIDRWRTQPEEYRARVQNARQAAPTFSWERMEDRLLRVYRGLCESDL